MGPGRKRRVIAVRYAVKDGGSERNGSVRDAGGSRCLPDTRTVIAVPYAERSSQIFRRGDGFGTEGRESLTLSEFRYAIPNQSYGENFD
jgi:hypothetical protein